MNMWTEHTSQSSIDEEALRWLVLLRSGDATPVDCRQFEIWAATSASHSRAYNRISKLWADLDAAKPLLVEELTHAAKDWEKTARCSWFRSLTPRNVFALSTALAALALIIVMGTWWTTWRVIVDEYRTAKGQHRTIALSDGSIIVMNTDTALTTEFSGARRTVVLQSGEAFFTVSHHQKRPFEVVAGSGVARDVGTRFTVRRQQDEVTVTVVEGAVEVQTLPEKVGPEGPRMLTAGEQVSYAKHNPLSPVETVSIETAIAWTEGKVIFDGRLLAEAIHEISRYQDGEIRILDPQLNTLKVSGVFGLNDRDGFLKALETAIPVKATQVNGGLVILESREIGVPRG